MASRFIILAAILGFAGVALGAFGSHGLGTILETNGREQTFRTGTLYHLIHAVAILQTAILIRDNSTKWFAWAGYLFAFGILLFSGSLYALAITNIGIFGAIAPLGGLAFLGGWVSLTIGAIRRS